MSLIACGSIHKVMNGLVMTLKEDKRHLYVWLQYYVSNFGIKSYFMRSFFFLVYSAAVKCQPKLFPFGVNCRLQLAGLGKKKRRNCEANSLYVESDFGITDTTNKSFTVFFARRGVNFDRRVSPLSQIIRPFSYMCRGGRRKACKIVLWILISLL